MKFPIHLAEYYLTMIYNCIFYGVPKVWMRVKFELHRMQKEAVVKYRNKILRD